VVPDDSFESSILQPVRQQQFDYVATTPPVDRHNDYSQIVPFFVLEEQEETNPNRHTWFQAALFLYRRKAEGAQR
jgi:hypothetical protein